MQAVDFDLYAGEDLREATMAKEIEDGSFDDVVGKVAPAVTSAKSSKNKEISAFKAHPVTGQYEMDNIVVKPSHYTQYNIEPVTFIMENRLSFEIGNIVKYACRAGHKMYPDQDYKQSRITDLRKVMRYAEMEINRLEGKEVL